MIDRFADDLTTIVVLSDLCVMTGGNKIAA
jgi:hypothetical protein